MLSSITPKARVEQWLDSVERLLQSPEKDGAQLQASMRSFVEAEKSPSVHLGADIFVAASPNSRTSPKPGEDSRDVELLTPSSTRSSDTPRKFKKRKKRVDRRQLAAVTVFRTVTKALPLKPR